MKIHWNILDKKRKSVLPLLRNFIEDDFYLAGGTGLALQLGHRDSLDFDFFKIGDFDTEALTKKLESVFKDHDLSITQQEKNTISCIIDDSIQLSFFGYDYDLLSPLIKTEYFKIASTKDIACMKLSAMASRAKEKDYVDVYFILQKISLDELLVSCEEKYRSLDKIVILKSLCFFEDVQNEPILFKERHKITWEKLKKYYEKLITAYVRQKQLTFPRKNTIRKNRYG